MQLIPTSNQKRFTSRTLVSLPKSNIISSNSAFFVIVPEFPYCWTLLGPDISYDKTLKVFAAFENGISVLDYNTRVFYEIKGSPIIFIAISSNGRFVATFSEACFLRVYTVDFSAIICEFDSKNRCIPNQVVWCGSDAVLIVWSDVYLIVGPEATSSERSIEEFTIAVSEVDGARLLSKSNCGYIAKVPDEVQNIFGIGSTSPGAMLYDAVDLFEVSKRLTDFKFTWNVKNSTSIRNNLRKLWKC